MISQNKSRTKHQSTTHFTNPNQTETSLSRQSKINHTQPKTEEKYNWKYQIPHLNPETLTSRTKSRIKKKNNEKPNIKQDHTNKRKGLRQ